jgi:hypothetical protein
MQFRFAEQKLLVVSAAFVLTCLRVSHFVINDVGSLKLGGSVSSVGMLLLLLLVVVVVVVVIRARRQGSGCTAAIRLIVHPVF